MEEQTVIVTNRRLFYTVNILFYISCILMWFTAAVMSTEQWFREGHKNLYLFLDVFSNTAMLPYSLLMLFSSRFRSLFNRKLKIRYFDERVEIFRGRKRRVIHYSDVESVECLPIKRYKSRGRRDRINDNDNYYEKFVSGFKVAIRIKNRSFPIVFVTRYDKVLPVFRYSGLWQLYWALGGTYSPEMCGADLCYPRIGGRQHDAVIEELMRSSGELPTEKFPYFEVGKKLKVKTRFRRYELSYDEITDAYIVKKTRRGLLSRDHICVRLNLVSGGLLEFVIYKKIIGRTLFGFKEMFCFKYSFYDGYMDYIDTMSEQLVGYYAVVRDINEKLGQSG